MALGRLGLAFNKIDLFLFSKIALIENSAVYNKYKIFLKDHFDQHIQKIFNRALTLFLLTLPLFIVLILAIMTAAKQNELKELKAINNSIKNITSKTEQLDRVKNVFLKLGVFSSKSKLSSQVSSILAKYNSPSTRVNVSEFSALPMVNLQKVMAKVDIKGASTEGLLNLSKELINRYHIAIDSIEVNRNSQETLDSVLELHYFIVGGDKKDE